jgi:transglutaminase-like putative cysteine protease
MRLLLAAVCWMALAAACFGQSREASAPDDSPGEWVTSRWNVGMVVTAQGGEFHQIVGTTTVPTDWPEQRVRAVEEDLSPGVTISYQMIEGVARQMLVTIPSLAGGQQAKAVVTFEIKRLLQKPPGETDAFLLPSKRPDAKLASYLRPSPYIESSAPQVLKLAKEVGADKEKAWEKVEAIYDWVRAEVKFEDNRGRQVKGVLATLRDRTGDCDEMTSLFIALCRANSIPARTVRVPRHVYPEFYLLDRDGKGHWFPCQVSGTRAFGGMPDPRPILQKGDNVRVTDAGGKKRKTTTVRILPDTLVGPPGAGGGKPRLELVCERVDE